ncbi:hypothetical protein [Candidatus Chlamydia corallus]|uniref:hypothetical protein n=1 Tax=Candidatus Chlamydia corallus TaxID=2038470 RepID=UPI001EFE49FF|nr:hypothetical protein [Candidatus Chlamydia corallus]
MTKTSITSLTTDHSPAQIKKKSSRYFDKIESQVLFITTIFAVLATIGTLLIGVLLNIPVIYFLTGLVFVTAVLSAFMLYKKTVKRLKDSTHTEEESIEPQHFFTPASFSSIPVFMNFYKENWEEKSEDLELLPSPSLLLTNNPYKVWEAKNSLLSLVSIQGGNPEHLLISSKDTGKTLLIEETSEDSYPPPCSNVTASPESLINEAFEKTTFQVTEELPTTGDSATFSYWQPHLRGQVSLPKIPFIPQRTYQYYYALYVTYIQTAIDKNIQLIQIPLCSLREHLYPRELTPKSRQEQSLAMVGAIQYMAKLYPDYPLTIACVERT